MKREDLQTIILNAKALIERDADFARAGQVLLSYIYEEVLEWDIVEMGWELKDAHRRGEEYLKRALRLNVIRLLDFASTGWGRRWTRRPTWTLIISAYRPCMTAI